MKKLLGLGLAAICMLAGTRSADAFCGFYVNGAGSEMFNDATQVVLMRMGTRTVLSMQNHYDGPVGDFAMVVPVPVVLHEGDVKTLPKEVFAKVDTMGSPRLVEYWEQDPCQPDYREYDRAVATGMAAPTAEAAKPADGDFGVTIEAQFVVGEYNIVILSAKDSTGLDAWLTVNNYKIPPNAEPLLRPYVEGGSKFFVAKVDPKKVKFDSDGRAELSPLRFHYDHEEFALPIRLGLANSSGKQDLIVSILSPEGRYEMANYKNVTIPTNLDVKDDVRNRFAEFYAALFDRTVEKNPGAIITEYAWDASTCDPCPGPQLEYNDFATLGSDVLGGGPGKIEAWQGYGMVLTRLHARYGKDQVPDDLVFKKADAIVGGREFVVDQKTGKLEEGARKDSMNNFQGRYAIRHEWTGPIECKDPRRGRWGGPPAGEPYTGVKPAVDLAFAPRGNLQLPQAVAEDVPEIDIKAAGAAPGGAAHKPWSKKGEEKKSGGCGCQSQGSPGGVLLLLGAALLVTRRRRSRV
jgi:MYXO-CTERM domain-containing protein